MPTCRRKKVVLTEPPEPLRNAVKTNPDQPVYYIHQTGELFDTYEAYAARMSFYRLKQFQCEVTGKSGLDYFQAVESERNEAATLHSRFSEQLKPHILKAVQWQIIGRLDHLVEAVYERFKDRYFLGEKVLVDLSGSKYYATIDRIYPPKYGYDQAGRDALKDLPPSESGLDKEPVHAISGDLKIPAKDVNAQDNPTLYFYWVYITEPEKDRAMERTKAAAQKIAELDTQMIGSLMEVQCSMMSRDRLSFSKSILRRFIRDCVDRDPAVASPWTVKPAIAKRFGVDSVMPEETRKGVESVKKGEIDKRKKVWEDKEGPPTKKQKRQQDAQAEKKDRETREKEEKARLAKQEAERIAAEKKKKKPVRYPTEDLDVRISDKDKKAGVKVRRPVASQTALPFNHTSGIFERFLMVWNFVNVYGHALHISPFTLDDFEHAIRHSVAEPPCTLLAEVHAALIYNLRTVPFVRHSALLALMRLKDDIEDEEESPFLGVSLDTLTSSMADFGNNWERCALRHNETRKGWENALFGCLKDHATLQNFPRMREILTRLLFVAETAEEPTTASTSSREPSPVSGSDLSVASNPKDSYLTLSAADRIDILAFLCDVSISSKAIHQHMESSEESLTSLRKEKIEVNRQKKGVMEQLAELKGEPKEEVPPTPSEVEDDSMAQDSESEVGTSENGSEAGKKGSTRQKELRTQALAKQRELARAKASDAKAAAAERRRLDEELNKVERKLEHIEREFRRLLGSVRAKPIGKDRFHNRIWWFDGLGCTHLVGSGGAALYGSGRIFIQGPSEFDLEILNQRQKEDDIEARRLEEEGEEGTLGSGEWAVYSELEELEEFVAWLNPKGQREVALKAALTKWWIHISAGIKRRQADIQASTKIPEARRSARTKASNGFDTSSPYLSWINKKAAQQGNVDVKS